MNRTVLLARLWELCERLTDPEDIATLLVAIAVIQADGHGHRIIKTVSS